MWGGNACNTGAVYPLTLPCRRPEGSCVVCILFISFDSSEEIFILEGRKAMMFRKIISVLFVAVLCFSTLTISLAATTVTQDGLEVTLSADKSSYTVGEQIIVTITLTNTNDFALTDVTIEGITSEGYELVSNYQSGTQIGTLTAGESATFSATYKATSSSGNAYPFNIPIFYSTGDEGNGGETTEVVVIEDPVEGGMEASESESFASNGRNNDYIIIIFALGIVAVVATVFVIVSKFKQGKRLLALFLCISMTGSMIIAMSVVVETEEVQSKTISVVASVTVSGQEVKINGTVSYGFGLTIPDDPSEADEYYWSNATVIDVISADESDNIMNEAEATSFLESRGFDSFEIVCEYSMTGDYDSSSTATEDSTTEHPMYTTYYYSANSELWTIYIIDGDIFAYPVSYIIETEAEIPVLISESSETISYDGDTNQFYVTVPFESSVIVKVVDTINAETLDNLTVEEIDKL